ncbi:hypothetical protein KP509_30G012100 [Ceratopteris richardii]|uniref:Uncharacterized protein n=1 Tax=Ceratopteris richardii TaxID=49495 RepID=A0A8T2R1N5_CERRI|nr:hypothetical protein KP509_30G012100 [Ceratopteris richardii]
MAYKRHFQDTDVDNDNAEKRQCTNLQSVLLEELRVNGIQRFWTVLEPIIRQVELETRIENFFPATCAESREATRQLPSMEPSFLRLQFENKLALPLYTGSKVEGENRNSIRVCLQDAETGEAVRMDNESPLKLEIVVLEGDFSNDEEDWTYEDFENHVVKEREGKGPILAGDLTLSLKEGIGTLGELIFTDNSSWMRSKKFRLGVKLSTGFYRGRRVREAITEAFFVKDHRGHLYKKHYPPTLTDEVWRLEKIGKDGAYHKRLSEYQINTVKDLLSMYSIGPSKLREIFGTTMSTKTWDSIIEHAKTCLLNDTKFIYYPNENPMIGVLLNTVYQPLGIMRNESLVPINLLSDTEQVCLKKLLEEAYKDVNKLCELHASAHCEEPDFSYGSDRSYQVYGGPQHRQLLGRQNISFEQKVCKEISGSKDSLSECAANVLQCGTSAFTFDTNLKDCLPTCASSPGYLESMFLCGNDLQKGLEPVDENKGLYRPDLTCLNDYCHGRAFDPWGSNELSVLTGFASGSLSNPMISANNNYSFPRNVNHPRRRAHMGWLKLKVVLKCSYLMRKGISSRRRLEIKRVT